LPSSRLTENPVDGASPNAKARFSSGVVTFKKATGT
ncbi:hypothetical protein TSAR_001969, partial [Trichomalopsis sarcophagae]